MRTLILSSLFATVYVVAGSLAGAANAGVIGKSTPTVESQTQEVRCWRGAPYDGCGWGWRRTRWGNCRPC